MCPGISQQQVHKYAYNAERLRLGGQTMDVDRFWGPVGVQLQGRYRRGLKWIEMASV